MERQGKNSSLTCDKKKLICLDRPGTKTKNLKKRKIDNNFFIFYPLLKNFICLERARNFFLATIKIFYLPGPGLGILLAPVSFLQTYYDTYSSRFLSFYFFLLQISFCIFLLPALLTSLYYCYSNLFFLFSIKSRFVFIISSIHDLTHFYIFQKKKKKNYKKHYQHFFLIGLIHTKNHLKRLMGKIYHLLQKLIL